MHIPYLQEFFGSLLDYVQKPRYLREANVSPYHVKEEDLKEKLRRLDAYRLMLHKLECTESVPKGEMDGMFRSFKGDRALGFEKIYRAYRARIGRQPAAEATDAFFELVKSGVAAVKLFIADSNAANLGDTTIFPKRKDLVASTARQTLQHRKAWDQNRDPSGFNGSSAVRFWYQISEESNRQSKHKYSNSPRSAEYWIPPANTGASRESGDSQSRGADFAPVACHCWGNDPISCKRKFMEHVLAQIRQTRKLIEEVNRTGNNLTREEVSALGGIKRIHGVEL